MQTKSFTQAKRMAALGKPKSPTEILRNTEKLEQEKLLETIRKKYELDVSRTELLKQSHDSVVVGMGANNPEKVVQHFRKVQKHCDMLAGLDSIGDMNKADKLRQVIQNEAYVLAIVSEQK